MEKISSTLEPLTTAWGVSFNPNLVAADMIYSYRKVLPERIVSNPVAMNISGEGISRGLPLTSSLNLLELWIFRRSRSRAAARNDCGNSAFDFE